MSDFFSSIFVIAVIVLVVSFLLIKGQIYYERKDYEESMASYAADPYKIYCVVSREAIALMNGNRGKMISQGGHAFLHAFEDSINRFKRATREYLESGKAYKITLYVETTQELFELKKKYEDICGVALITDAAHTVFKEPTTTCIGIGPIRESQRDPVLAGLNPFI